MSEMQGCKGSEYRVQEKESSLLPTVGTLRHSLHIILTTHLAKGMSTGEEEHGSVVGTEHEVGADLAHVAMQF